MTVKELIDAVRQEVEKNPDVLNYLVTTEGFTVGTDGIEVDETLREICIV